MNPTILIENDVYRKVMHWVHKSQYEVSGLGVIKIEDGGILRVVQAILLPQKNGTATTDIEAEDVNRALFQLRNVEGELKWWWHSHVQMGVFWSGTDDDTIKKFGSGGWVVATVFNQKNEVKSCYYGAHDTKTPWGTTSALRLDDLVTKLTPLAVDDTREWDAEYDKNVTNVTPAVVTTYTGKSHTGTTRTNLRATGTTVGIAEVDVTCAPPHNKPPNMSKITFRYWKKAHKNWKEREMELSRQKFDLQQDDGLDDYGFDQEERKLFAEEGWDQGNFDDLLSEDFSPSDMLDMVRLKISPKDVEYYMRAYNYTVADIVDLMEQSESYGENLFERSLRERMRQ